MYQLIKRSSNSVIMDLNYPLAPLFHSDQEQVWVIFRYGDVDTATVARARVIDSNHNIYKSHHYLSLLFFCHRDDSNSRVTALQSHNRPLAHLFTSHPPWESYTVFSAYAVCTADFAVRLKLKGCSIMQKIVIEIGTEQTRLFQCNRFHCAENRQSPSRHLSENGWSVWIFMSRACCAWRNNQYILAAETVITNAACAAAAFIYLSHLCPLFSLLSKNFDLWRQFYITVNHATRDLN